MIQKILGVTALFILVSFFVIVVLALDLSVRQKLVKSERALCQRVITDRLGTIKVRETQAESAGIIADDKFQSDKTRRARRNEAEILEKSIVDLRTRVDPENGGQLICTEEFPNPRIF